MKTIGIFKALLLSGALLGTTALQAGKIDQQEKTFQVGPKGSLVVEADRGNVEVKTGDAAKVNIIVIREHKGSDRDAADALGMHKIDFAQDGGKVTVKGSKTGGASDRKLSKLQVKYIITTPREFNLTLKTAGGNLSAEGVQGTHQLNTAGGNIDMVNLAGQLAARTAGGNIRGTNCKGPVTADTSGGNIDITTSEGEVTANTAGGNISIAGATGKVLAKTSGGNIQIKDLKGSVMAKTHGGNVRAHLVSAPTEACELKTSAGSIQFDVLPSAAFEVRARTTAGRVSTDFDAPVQNKFGNGKMDAKINGGGPVVTLETNAGDVRIRKI